MKRSEDRIDKMALAYKLASWNYKRPTLEQLVKARQLAGDAEICHNTLAECAACSWCRKGEGK